MNTIDYKTGELKDFFSIKVISVSYKWLNVEQDHLKYILKLHILINAKMLKHFFYFFFIMIWIPDLKITADLHLQCFQNVGIKLKKKLRPKCVDSMLNMVCLGMLLTAGRKVLMPASR